MGGGGGGQSSTTTYNPALLGFAQNQFASGNLAPPQNLNLHPDTMDPATQNAINMGMGAGSNGLLGQASGVAGNIASGAGAPQQSYAEPNSYLSSVQGGQYAQPGAYMSPYANSPSYGLLNSTMAGNMLHSNPIAGTGANNYLADAIHGKYLDAQNPFFQQMVEQSQQAARPGLDAAFASSGRFGSGNRQAAISDAFTRQADQLGFQNYTQERGLQQQAAQFKGGLLANNYAAERGMQNQNAMGLLNQGFNAYGNERAAQGNAAAQLSQNIGNANQSQLAGQQQQLQGAGLLSQIFGQQLSGANAAAGLQQDFNLGNWQDTANQQNYDQSKNLLGFQRFMQALQGAQGGQQVQNTGGNGALQTVGAVGGGLATAASLAASISLLV